MVVVVVVSGLCGSREFGSPVLRSLDGIDEWMDGWMDRRRFDDFFDFLFCSLKLTRAWLVLRACWALMEPIVDEKCYF